MKKDKILTLNNICFKFSKNDFDFFHNLNLEIFENEKIVIIGENGSGKSTLCKIISGLYFVQSGQITFLKNDPTSFLQVNMVFQNPDDALVGKTVEEELAFSLENLNLSYEQMHEIMNDITNKFALNDILYKDIISLSGGVKQKVSIASALVSNPQIIIFDEAASQLDNKEHQHFNELVDFVYHDLKKTIIMVSHDINDVLSADRVFYLDKNHNIFVFSANDFLKKIESDENLAHIIKLSELMEFNKLMQFNLLNEIDDTINNILNLCTKK